MGKRTLCIMLFLINIFNVSYGAENICNQKVPGFSIVPQSTYFFHSKDGEACFFAYYIKNPVPDIFSKEHDHLEDSIWYAYYIKSDPEKIIKLPMPKDNNWGFVCDIHAISFIDINGDGRRDITIIGACDKQNAIDLTFPFVFINTGKHYIFNEHVYGRLFAFTGLSIADIRAYFKDPDTYYNVLEKKSGLR